MFSPGKVAPSIHVVCLQGKGATLELELAEARAWRGFNEEQQETRNEELTVAPAQQPAAGRHSAVQRMMEHPYGGSRIPSLRRYGMVQRQRTEQQDSGSQSEAIHAHAAKGVSGSASDYPHKAPIEAALGVPITAQAHVGGEATKASDAIGAQAYATGNDVAFGSNPDLHTAAHEAVHTLQQQRGVSLKGGVGEAGDAHEKQADQVADAVVAGRSAKRLLGNLVSDAGATGGYVQKKSSDATVQRKGDVIPVEIVEALQNFETVVNNESKEEAAPKSTGLIVLEEIGKFVSEKVVDFAAEVVPG